VIFHSLLRSCARNPQFYAKTPEELLVIRAPAWIAKRFDGKASHISGSCRRHASPPSVPDDLAPFYTSASAADRRLLVSITDTTCRTGLFTTLRAHAA